MKHDTQCEAHRWEPRGGATLHRHEANPRRLSCVDGSGGKAPCLTNMQLLYTFHCVQIYFAFTLWKGWTSKCRWIDIQRCCLLLAYTCESKIPVFIFACNRRGGCVWVFQRETTASLNSSIGGVWSLTYDRQRLSCLDFKRKRSPQMLTSSETKWQLQWRVGWLSVYTEVVFAF